MTGQFLTDFYHLSSEPDLVGGRVELRIREDEQERTVLDEVGLLAVDHSPNLHAVMVDDRPALGRTLEAPRVTTQKGVDVTELLARPDGKSFSGRPGDVLIVKYPSRGPILFDGDDPIEKNGARQAREELGGGWTPEQLDRWILEKTGIRIEIPNGKGGWSDVRRRYAREYPADFTFGPLTVERLRIVFVGTHKLDYLGALAPVDVQPVVTKLSLVEATHTRTGDVVQALSSRDRTTVSVSPGERIALSFEAVPLAAGLVRDYFLVSHGVYTALARSSGTGPAVQSTRFLLAQNEPNPFSSSTTIEFELPTALMTRLEVYDLAGRRVALLAEANFPAGRHVVNWDRRDEDIRPGVYFYRLSAGPFREQRRLVILP